MRNYFYISDKRTNSIYNQLVASTPVEIIRKELDKEGILTDWKSGAKAGFVSLIGGEVGYSKSTNKERTFEENIRYMVELEQKVSFIEEKINFVNVEELIEKEEPLIGRAASFSGAYYSKGLKTPNYYTSSDWDGLLPFLYKNSRGVNIKVVYSPLHFLSQTPWGVVRGRLRIDGIGFVANHSDNEVVITPIAFGLLISDAFTQIFEQ